jgi:putative membrane protein
MQSISTISVVAVAVIHILISVVEIFLWENAFVYERLGFDYEVAVQVTAIVKNIGLYNGFIAAGLLWGAFAKSNSSSIRIFFLICVLIAGIFGALTLKWTTLILQALPASIALLLVWLVLSKDKQSD